jgi:hypothetical protein
MATSINAALYNLPRTGTQRHRILVAAIEAGARGITSDEVADRLGLNLYSAKPRVIELRTGGWLRMNGQQRPSPRGCAVDVHVATDKARDAVEGRRSAA